VVNVRVRNHDLLHRELVLLEESHNFRNIIPRINHHRCARRFVANDGAVASQRTNWKNFMDHEVTQPPSIAKQPSRKRAS
jgi:hypothetical protein